MYCRKCSNNLIPQASGWNYCSFCDEMFKDEDIQKEEKLWYIQLAEDQELWREADDIFPTIILHEYQRIRDLLNKGNTYGAFFQTKDVLEILLKFPILVTLSNIHEISDNDTILSKVVKEPLSLGHWQGIGEELHGLKFINQNLDYLLESILEIYQKNFIVNWRNKIAHGGLQNDSDEDFQEDLRKKILLITNCLENTAHIYKNIDLYYYEATKKMSLKGEVGSDYIYRKWEKVFTLIDGKEISLYPYLFLDEKGIFFYDTFYSSKKRTDVLNYMSGKKVPSLPEINQEFYALYTKYKMIWPKLSDDSLVEDTTYSKSNKMLMDRIHEIDDYEAPDYIANWLKRRVDEDSTGVYLLQMERGMGKTTFARSLDNLSLNKYSSKFPTCSIRGYYINDIYLYNTKNFILELNETITKNEKGIPEIGGLVGMQINPKHPQKELAEFLNRSLEAHKRHFKYNGVEKMIIVIDGLDEIPKQSGQSIFDFIPRAELLKEGIYIVLTCRTDNEISPYAKRKIDKLRKLVKDEMVLKISNTDNQKLLTNYIYGRILSQYKKNEGLEDLIQSILNKAEHRFLYVKLIKDMLSGSKKLNISELEKGEELFEQYLQRLCFLYGDKYFINVLNLLTILGSAYTPLTFQEICYLMDKEGPNSEVMAYLLEIRSLLKIERNDHRGGTIALSHSDWIQFIQKKYSYVIQGHVKRWKENLLTLSSEKFDWDETIYDGETYIATYISNYIKDFLSNEMLDKEQWEKIDSIQMKIANKLTENVHLYYQLQRGIFIYSEQIEKTDDRKLSLNDINYNKLISLYGRRAHTFYHMEQIEKSKSDYKYSIKILKPIVQNSQRNELLYSSLLTNLANTCNHLKESEALSFYNEAVEVLSKLYSKDISIPLDTYVRALLGRGMIYYSNRSLTLAFEDYKEITGLLESNSLEEQSIPTALIAEMYSNKSMIYESAGKLEKALEMIEKSVDLIQSVTNDNMKIVIYMNRGIIKDRKKYPVESILEDYEKALEQIQVLQDQGKIVSINTWADLYINFGMIYHRIKESEKALTYYSEAIDMRENTINKNLSIYIDNNRLAISYLDRGNLYLNLFEDKNKAKLDYIKAINIWSNFDKNKKILDYCHLAYAYEGLGNCYEDEDLERAKYYTSAVDCIEKGIENGANIDEGKLAFYYNEIARIYGIKANKESKYASKAILAYEKVLNFLKDHKDNTVLSTLLHMWGPNCYKNLGELYRKGNSKNKAIMLYTEAIELWDRKEKSLQIEKMDLIEFYSLRGDLYCLTMDSDLYTKAIEDFEYVVGNLENLADLEDRWKLSKFYYLYFIGNYYFSKKQWQHVSIYHKQAIELAEDLRKQNISIDGNRLSGCYFELACAIYKSEQMIGDIFGGIFGGRASLGLFYKCIEEIDLLKKKGERFNENLYNKCLKNIKTIETL